MNPPVLDWPTVVVDTREPDPEHDAEDALFWPAVYVPVSTAKGVRVPAHVAALPIVRETLATGDYSLPEFRDSVTIERKTLADMLHTLFGHTEDCLGDARPEQERFRAELDRMSAMNRANGRAMIMVEAAREDVWRERYRVRIWDEKRGHHRVLYRRIEAVMVMNAVDSFWGDYGVPTIWAGDRNGAQLLVGETLMRIAEQALCKGDAYRKAMARGVAPYLPWMTGEREIERGVAGHRPWLAQHTGEEVVG
jgi:hypothetical protein